MSDPIIGKDEPVFLATPVSGVDIPDLKKKEKERKKAGAAWGQVKTGGSPFNGATGGNGAASTFAGAGRLAQNAAAGAGGFSRFKPSLVSRLWGTFAGKLILAGFTALIAGALTIIGSQMMVRAPYMVPNLGGISSSIQVAGADHDRLQYAAGSGKGQIKYDETPGLPDWAKQQEPAPADEPPAPYENPFPSLPHNLSVAKLTSQLGGCFGGKDIFSGAGVGAPKFGDGFDRSKIANLTPPQPKGVSRAMKGNRRVASQKALAFRGRSARAMVQLKLARAMSVAGANSTQADTSKGRATDAFEQRAITRG